MLYISKFFSYKTMVKPNFLVDKPNIKHKPSIFTKKGYGSMLECALNHLLLFVDSPLLRGYRMISWYPIHFYSNRYIITLILNQIFMYFCKVYSQLAKITITPTNSLYPITSPPTRWTNRPINKVHTSNLNWRQFFSCQYIQIHV